MDEAFAFVGKAAWLAGEILAGEGLGVFVAHDRL